MPKFFPLILLTVFGLSLVLNFAQAGLIPCGGEGQPECTICHFFVLAQSLFYGLLFMLAGVSLFVGIIIGFMFFIGSANPNALTTAKKALTAALIGFFLMLTSWLIITTVGQAMGWKQSAGAWKESDQPQAKWYQKIEIQCPD